MTVTIELSPALEQLLAQKAAEEQQSISVIVEKLLVEAATNRLSPCTPTVQHPIDQSSPEWLVLFNQLTNNPRLHLLPPLPLEADDRASIYGDEPR